MKPLIIAHRGWSGRYPENTLIAFEKALELPVGGIEFDLRMTADRKIVISHNFDVDTRSNGSGYIADMTLAELKKLDFGIKKGEEFAGTRIPEFQELLELVAAKRPDIWLAVEIKDDNWELAKIVVEELKRRGFDDHCSIISFKSNVLRAVRIYAPHIPRHGFSVLSLPNEAGKEEYLSLVNRVGIFVKRLTLEMADFYHQRGITVDTWAPGNADEYAVARACKVDYLTTNDPDIILDLQAKAAD